MNPKVIADIQHLIALAFLAYFAISDLKERSVPSLPLYTFIGIEAVLLAVRLLSGYNPPLNPALYVLVDTLLVAMVAAMTLSCLKGPGDLLVYIGVVLSEPFSLRLLPAPLTVLLYYSLYSIAPSIYIALRNLADRDSRRHLVRERPLRALRLLFTARPIRADEARRYRWWMPIDMPEARRSVCSEEVEPWQIVADAVEKGRLRPDSVVWVTYGIPAIVPMLVAYATLLLVGDEPITLLLSRIAGYKA